MGIKHENEEDTQMIYDFSKELQKFHDECLVLPDEAVNELNDKKDLNIKRLRDGLDQYIKDSGKKYKIEKFVVQGSMAMDTAIQNDENDFDIDVGVIFDANTIIGVGHREIKNIIVDCFLNKWPNQFSKDPEAKRNCVTISYQDGYHLDFALYRHSKGVFSTVEKYEHAGSTTWNKRNPYAINKWFDEQVESKGEFLRTIVRLSKALVKSSSYSVLPGGLIQTVLLDECFVSDQRLDLCFYRTLKMVYLRLLLSEDVCNPVDSTLTLIDTEEHRHQVQNYQNIIKKALDKIDEIENKTVGYNDAARVWNDVFDCDYWNAKLEESYSVESKNAISIYERNSLEQFVENLYSMNLYQKDFQIKCVIGFDGQRKTSLAVVNARYKGVPIGPNIYCSVSPTFKYDDILWKVRNRGPNAETPERIRGQIVNRGLSIKETSNFSGNHYIECYAIRNGTCIAATHINIRIINKKKSKGVL